MRIQDSLSDYTARPVELSDLGFLCETLEDFPVQGGFSIAKVQNELSAMRRLVLQSRGLAIVLSKVDDPLSITTMSRQQKTDDFACITLQATHPTHRQQGHGFMTSLVRGFVAFELERLDYLTYDIELHNVAGEGLVKKWEEVHARAATSSPGRIEPSKTYNRSVFTKDDWDAYILSNNIDLTRFTLLE